MRSFKNFRDQAVVVDLLKQQGFIQNEKPNEVLQTLGYRYGKLFIQRDDSDIGLQEWQRDVNNKVYDNMKFSNNELGLFKIRESQIQESKQETKIEILKNIFQGISNFQGVYNLVNFLYFYNKNVTNFEIFDQSAFFEIVSISFHPFKNLVAVATPFKILFYNLDQQDFDFSKTLEFGLDSQILTVEYSPLSGLLAIGATDKFIILDLDSEKSAQEIYSLKKPVESVSWAYDETFLCFVSRKNPIVYVYNLEFKQLIKLQRVCQVFTNVLCSPQGRYILAYDKLYKSQIRIWDVSNWECTYLQTDGQVQNVCLSQDENFVLFTTKNSRTIQIVQLNYQSWKKSFVVFQKQIEINYISTIGEQQANIKNMIWDEKSQLLIVSFEKWDSLQHDMLLLETKNFNGIDLQFTPKHFITVKHQEVPLKQIKFSKKKGKQTLLASIVQDERNYISFIPFYY